LQHYFITLITTLFYYPLLPLLPFFNNTTHLKPAANADEPAPQDDHDHDDTPSTEHHTDDHDHDDTPSAEHHTDDHQDNHTPANQEPPPPLSLQLSTMTKKDIKKIQIDGTLYVADGRLSTFNDYTVPIHVYDPEHGIYDGTLDRSKNKWISNTIVL
jgi:hypothetical protein